MTDSLHSLITDFPNQGEAVREQNSFTQDVYLTLCASLFALGARYTDIVRDELTAVSPQMSATRHLASVCAVEQDGHARAAADDAPALSTTKGDFTFCQKWSSMTVQWWLLSSFPGYRQAAAYEHRRFNTRHQAGAPW